MVDIVFGNGENTFHVILECYGGGNIILTDYHFEILALLRTYTLSDGTAVDVKRTYNVQPSWLLFAFVSSRAARALR